MAEEFKFNVLDDLGTIEEPPSGYDTRVKIISWNDGPPKLDIRKWNKNNDKMSKGISISLDAAILLKELLDNINYAKYDKEFADYEPEEDE